MSSAIQEAITLGAQMGGKDADAATDEQVLKFRRLLRDECQGPYSNIIKEFALVLRIDGAIDSWGKSGVANVFLRPKQRYGTADIFVPKEIWAEGIPMNFRDFLATEVPIAIRRIAERAQVRKIHISSDQLSSDVDVAVRKFLST